MKFILKGNANNPGPDWDKGYKAGKLDAISDKPNKINSGEFHEMLNKEEVTGEWGNGYAEGYMYGRNLPKMKIDE